MVIDIKKLFVVLLFGIVLSLPVYADLMSFTANVKDGSGNNFGAGDVVVEIYDAASGGNLIYNSTNDFLKNVSNGQIDIMLGSGVQQLNLAYGSDYYMEVYLNRTDLDFQGQERQRFQAGIGNVTLNKVNVSTSLVPTTNSTLNLGQSSNGWWNNIFGVTGYFLSKVGIGTTNPTSALNVTGDVGVTGIVTANAFVGSGAGLTGVSSMVYTNLALTNQSNSFSGNITITENLTVDGGTLYVDSVNNRVGILTVSPSSALNVTGDVGVTGTVTATSFVGSGTGLTGISGMSYTNLALTNQSNVFSGNVTIANNLTVGNNRLYVDGRSNGYVGINTTTPSSVLHVNGQLNVSVGSNTRIYFGKGYVYDNGNALVLGHD
ncbi:hypothetical protein J4413_01370 [Candidatus Woesearchaeota archaeon]|nr:hypothetical protein [Candidatus Woesearchaeota archaeon]